MIREQDASPRQSEDASIDDEHFTAHVRDTSTVSSRIATFRHDVSTWAGRWGYAVSHRTPPVGYRKPIPFDHALFSTLDSKIDFQEDPDHRPRSGTVVSSEQDAELRHEPDHAIEHARVAKLVIPHHGIRPWEDIPPYQRSRGYNDQPDYTDDYDDFLWLPRDPLSTLDLDDTVEMRLALTTSQGGSGRIGDWPPVAGGEESEEMGKDDQWQEVYRHQSQSPELDRYRSAETTSDQGLIAPAISPNIGSQVEEVFDVGLVRRGTKKMGDGLTSLFRRPRTDTNLTDGSGAEISMRTLSFSSAHPMNQGGSSTPLMSALPTPDRPSIQLIQQRDTSQRIPTPIFAPRGPRPQGSTFSQADSVFSVTPAVGTPEQEPVQREIGDSPVEELNLDPPSRISRLTIQAGKSPSGPRPQGRLRAGSRASGRSSVQASVLSPTRQRSMALGRDRSTSVFSAQQEAWLKEVMEEERLASKDSKKEELAEKAVDEEELLKEERRLAGLGRSSSKMEGGMGRSKSIMTRSKSRRVTSDSAASGQGDGTASIMSGEGLARPIVERRGSSAQSAGSVNSNATVQASRFSPGIGPSVPPKTAPM